MSCSFALWLHYAPDASKFRDSEYGSKTTICQRAAMFPLEKWWCARASILLESLFLIRIGSRDPGQHFLM
jgi:hypothetical protein